MPSPTDPPKDPPEFSSAQKTSLCVLLEPFLQGYFTDSKYHIIENKRETSK